MLTLPIALDLARDLTGREALSALPDAPVRDDLTRPAGPATASRRTHRTRYALAGGLHRLADRVAPAPECRPAL